MAQEVFQVTTPCRAAAVAAQDLLEQADSRCKEVTAAHGKTFYLAGALLPVEKCRAIRALYAFCLVTDDIVDEPPTNSSNPAAALAEWRRTVRSLQPPSGELVATAWLDTRLRYEVPYGYADQLIDGIASDLHPRRYDTFDELTTYAYKVASTAGLMSMHIIGLVPGVSRAEAMPYMIRLGVALQLTNILCDVGENRRAGRVYLPLEELAAFGLGEEDLDCTQADDRWRAFMRFQIERTRAIYAAGPAGGVDVQCRWSLRGRRCLRPLLHYPGRDRSERLRRLHPPGARKHVGRAVQASRCLVGADAVAGRADQAGAAAGPAGWAGVGGAVAGDAFALTVPAADLGQGGLREGGQGRPARQERR
jgi:phytoene/squalene synthetase